jgi:hypothetical protein
LRDFPRFPHLCDSAIIGDNRSGFATLVAKKETRKSGFARHWHQKNNEGKYRHFVANLNTLFYALREGRTSTGVTDFSLHVHTN